MGRFVFRYLAFAALVVAMTTGKALAYSVDIQDFRIDRDGSLYIQDMFDDGNPPPSGDTFPSGNPVNYSTRGIFTESGGSVNYNTANGEIGPTPFSGNPFVRHQATLRTNRSNNINNINSGLKDIRTFAVTGLFDLTTALPQSGSYGIRLIDRGLSLTPPNEGDNTLELRVRNDPTFGLEINFLHQDFETSTLTTIARVLLNLDSTIDQIMLSMDRLDTSDDHVTASFAYGRSGTFDAFTDLTPIVGREDDALIFQGERWIRAGFYAREPIPEPSTLLLLASGLVGLAAWRRRTITGEKHGRDEHVR